MIRHAVLVVAAAVALILAPTAAMAYAPAGFSVPVTDPTPAAGVPVTDPTPAAGIPVKDPTPAAVPFTVHATGANANEAVTLTMTPDPASIGTKSLTQIANAQGVVDFVVTLTEDGTYVLVATSASGAVLSTQTVTVADHGAVLVAGASVTAGTGASVNAGTAASVTAGTGASAAAGTGASAAAGTDASVTAGTAAGTAASVTVGGQLSYTGFQGLGLAVGGGMLVLVGTGLVLVSQRPRVSRVTKP